MLHVSQPVTGGVARSVLNMVADQLGRGWRVAVACPAAGELAPGAADAGAGHVRWEATRSPSAATALELRRLSAVLATVRPDVVHLHSSKAMLVGRLLLRGRLATIVQPHGWSFWAVGGSLRPAVQAWERAAARWADLAVCVSADEREAGRRAGIRCRWAVVENGVDLDAFAPAGDEERAGARSRLGLAGGPLAVCLGRLHRAKGQDVLLAAWPHVLRRVPDARLIVVGDGPDRVRLARDAPVGVDFAGAQADVRDWLAAADVVVSPSRWEAGCPFAVVEAMATARTVVASDVAGMREALAGAGAVVAPEEPRTLADAVAVRLADPALAREEGLEGRRRAAAHHALADKTARIAELTAAVLEAHRGQ